MRIQVVLPFDLCIRRSSAGQCLDLPLSDTGLLPRSLPDPGAFFLGLAGEGIGERMVS